MVILPACRHNLEYYGLLKINALRSVWGADMGFALVRAVIKPSGTGPS